MKDILKFNVQQLASWEFLEWLANHCYNETGRKFWVTFNGSKGYLDNVEIQCEGAEPVRIHRRFFNNAEIKSKTFILSFSKKKGLQLAIQNTLEL